MLQLCTVQRALVLGYLHAPGRSKFDVVIWPDTLLAGTQAGKTGAEKECFAQQKIMAHL